MLASKTDGSGLPCYAHPLPAIPTLPTRTQPLRDIDQADFLGLSADGNDNQFFGQLNSSFARLDEGDTSLELEPGRDRQRQRERELELEFELSDPLPLSLISSADLDAFELESISNCGSAANSDSDSDSDSDPNSDFQPAGHPRHPDRPAPSLASRHPAGPDGSPDSGPQANQPSHHHQQHNIRPPIDPTSNQRASSLSSSYSQSSFCYPSLPETLHHQPIQSSHPLKYSALKTNTVQPSTPDPGYPPPKSLAHRPAPLKISKPPPLPIIANDLPTPFSLSSSTSTASTSLSTPPGSSLRYSTCSTRLSEPHSPSLNTTPISPSKPPVWIVGQLNFTGRGLDTINAAEMSKFQIPAWAEDFVYAGAESGSATLAPTRPSRSRRSDSLPQGSPACSPKTQPTAIPQAHDNYSRRSQPCPAAPPHRRSGDDSTPSPHPHASKPKTTSELPFRSPARPDFPQYELSETDEGLSDWFEANARVAAGPPPRRVPVGQFRRTASTPDHRCPHDGHAFGSGNDHQTAFVYRRTSSQFDTRASRPGALSPLPEASDDHLGPRWTFKGGFGGLVRSLKARGSKGTSPRQPAPGRRTSDSPNLTCGPKSPGVQSLDAPQHETHSLGVHPRRGTGLALSLVDEQIEGEHGAGTHELRRPRPVSGRNAYEKGPVRMSQIDPRLRMAESPVLYSPTLVQGPVQWR